MKIFFFSFLFVFIFSQTAFSGKTPGDFDWGNVQDMQGAFYMCASLGFPNSDCRKVLRRCYTDPRLIEKIKSLFGMKIKSKCTKYPPLLHTAKGLTTDQAWSRKIWKQQQRIEHIQ